MTVPVHLLPLEGRQDGFAGFGEYLAANFPITPRGEVRSIKKKAETNNSYYKEAVNFELHMAKKYQGEAG